MKNIIEINHLVKRYGDLTAVSDLSFKVKEGELFAFLGINGAGKSTTINIICGQLAYDEGEVLIDGQSLKDAPNSVKSKIGVVFQDSVLDMALTVYDNLKSRAALYGIFDTAFDEKLAYLSRLLDFSDIIKRRVGKLSGGQRRRIDIARALIADPEILILDEPTTGLDPKTRSLLWDVISSLRKGKNMTVFLTTHYMEEAEALSDRIGIMKSGKLLICDKPQKIITKSGEENFEKAFIKIIKEGDWK